MACRVRTVKIGLCGFTIAIARVPAPVPRRRGAADVLPAAGRGGPAALARRRRRRGSSSRSRRGSSSPTPRPARRTAGSDGRSAEHERAGAGAFRDSAIVDEGLAGHRRLRGDPGGLGHPVPVPGELPADRRERRELRVVLPADRPPAGRAAAVGAARAVAGRPRGARSAPPTASTHVVDPFVNQTVTRRAASRTTACTGSPGAGTSTPTTNCSGCATWCRRRARRT